MTATCKRHNEDTNTMQLITTATTGSRHSLVSHRVPRQVPSVYQPFIFVTQSQNTAVQYCKNQKLLPHCSPHLYAVCNSFQIACKPLVKFYGYQWWSMHPLLLYAINSSPYKLASAVYSLISLTTQQQDLHIHSQFAMTQHSVDTTAYLNCMTDRFLTDPLYT